MTFPSRQHVTVPEHVLFRELKGEAVLLNLVNECYFGLDAMGTTMWQKLTTQSTVQEAYEVLLSSYAVAPDVLQTDITRLITELVENGLLELSDG
ncbi:MAG: PqqD family protein [Anaerolineales bacterium]|nr:PqqD family protein [Anaerolineales bacterium]MCA9953068.1 PqqD family protein [Anaerolineales bacterium]